MKKGFLNAIQGRSRAWSFRGLCVGVIGLICSDYFGLLNNALPSVVYWLSMVLVVLSIVVIIGLVVKQVTAQRTPKIMGPKVFPGVAAKSVGKKVSFPDAHYVVSILVIALGLALIFLVPESYPSYKVQTQAARWPTTQGEVISAKVIENKGGFSADDDRVQPQIITQYFVHGKRYVTREIYFNQSQSWGNNEEFAFTMKRRYAAGSQVDVFYNPDNPAQAVLETQVGWFTYLMMFLGGALVVLGIYGVLIVVRQTWYFLMSVLVKPSK